MFVRMIIRHWMMRSALEGFRRRTARILIDKRADRSHVRLTDFRGVIDQDSGSRDPGISHEIAVIAPSRSCNRDFIGEFYGVILHPPRRFGVDWSTENLMSELLNQIRLLRRQAATEGSDLAYGGPHRLRYLERRSFHGALRNFTLVFAREFGILRLKASLSRFLQRLD